MGFSVNRSKGTVLFTSVGVSGRARRGLRLPLRCTGFDQLISTGYLQCSFSSALFFCTGAR